MEAPPSYRCSKCDQRKPLFEFPPSKAQHSGQWCRACLRADQRRIKGLAATERIVDCANCGTSFATTYTKAAFCSRACKDIARKAAAKAATLAAKPDRSCVWCGSTMPKTMRSDAKYCSADCNMQAHRRTRNYRRRAGEDAPLRPRKQPLPRLADIDKRDGHRCGICGGKTDLTIKHPDPLFVTLDHIVPLSRGGDPLDPANLRVAHLRCNSARRDRGTQDQLRLLG